MTVGILNAYHFDLTPGNYQEAYLPMCIDYLTQVLPGVKINTYSVAQGEFPQSIDECDAWLITGSPKSAYDMDDWILTLKKFIQDCDHAKVKLLGICFGHQLIAQALGGQVRRANVGWGVGVKGISVDSFKSWMHPEQTPCRLLFSHQDQVVILPKSAEVIANSDDCPVQMFSIGEYIFCMQGHPEFSKDYTKMRMQSRQEKLGEKVYKQGLDSLALQTHHMLIGKWVYNFFFS